jgi:hypothetical protein
MAALRTSWPSGVSRTASNFWRPEQDRHVAALSRNSGTSALGDGIDELRVELSRPDAAPPPRTSSPRPLDLLISLQESDGSWGLTRELAEAVGVRLERVRSQLGTLLAQDEACRAWATALALAWLEHEAPGLVVEWRLLARKAERWLDGVTVKSQSGLEWKEEARRFLAT